MSLPLALLPGGLYNGSDGKYQLFLSCHWKYSSSPFSTIYSVALKLKNGFVEITSKKIKYDSENDPVKLVYASPSFTDDNYGPIIFVLVYEVNKNYNPWFNKI